MSSAPPYLILLKGGPTHDLNDYLAYHAKILSPSFEGEIWTFGAYEDEKVVGRIRLRCVKVKAASGLAALREFLAIVSKDVLARGETLRRRDVTITTYEPFVQPFVGYRLARALGAKLVIEFPGTYKDKDNFADVKNAWYRRLKYSQQKVLAQVAVWLSDAVRVHFPGQNDGFIKIPASKPTSFYYDAINLERFSPPTGQPKKYVLLVGFPYLRKGADTVLSAWHELAPKFPDWKLVLIGYELDKYMSEAELNSPQIQFIKPMNNADLAPWIQNCSILTVPSRSDTMPRVLMEGGAAGRPRVATRVGGMPYMMTDEVEGLFIPPANPAALRDALARLMADEGLRNKIGQAGLLSVHERFSGTKYRDDLLRCVRTLHKIDRPAPQLASTLAE